MIISTTKSIWHPSLIKTFHKSGIEGNTFDLIKGIYKNSILNRERLNALPVTSGTKQGLEALASAITGIKTFRLEVSNLSLFTDDMIM